MHWNETNDLNIKAVRRIEALLLALADLADRAGGRSRAVRCAVLWLLRPGESIASDYVNELTRDFHPARQPAPIGIPPSGDSPADAARLAQTFRALAAALATLAAAVSESPRIDFARSRLAGLARWASCVPAARPGLVSSPGFHDSS
ncbi:MAG: hypothetical protein Q8Q62_17155 [Mesorhizobium sp.]|nr:hypothetical protein [Mesorhizobium sp.]